MNITTDGWYKYAPVRSVPCLDIVKHDDDLTMPALISYVEQIYYILWGYDIFWRNSWRLG